MPTPAEQIQALTAQLAGAERQLQALTDAERAQRARAVAAENLANTISLELARQRQANVELAQAAADATVAGNAALARAAKQVADARAEHEASLKLVGDTALAAVQDATAKAAAEKALRSAIETDFGRVATSLGISFGPGEKPYKCVDRCLAQTRVLLGLEGMTTEQEVAAEAARRKREDDYNAIMHTLTAEQRALVREHARQAP